jgi:hypothetical protein
MSDTGLSARKIEAILRAAGISKATARRIVAQGWQATDDADADEAEAVAAITEAFKAAAERLKGSTHG